MKLQSGRSCRSGLTRAAMRLADHNTPHGMFRGQVRVKSDIFHSTRRVLKLLKCSRTCCGLAELNHVFSNHSCPGHRSEQVFAAALRSVCVFFLTAFQRSRSWDLPPSDRRLPQHTPCNVVAEYNIHHAKQPQEQGHSTNPRIASPPQAPICPARSCDVPARVR